MNEAEARTRAEAFAIAQGRELADYDEPRLELNEDEWWALFQGKSKEPGNFFSIVVADDGGDTRLIEGK